MRWFADKWDLFCAGVMAVVAACLLPHNAVSGVTTELIAFFSIQSAVILPAMIFTAGILKPDGLDLSDAKKYHKALKLQMLFWVGLLALDFIAVVALIMGKAIEWKLTVPSFDLKHQINFGWLIPVVLYFTGSLAVIRTIPFVRGVLSLLDLNSEMTEKAILRRNKQEIASRVTNTAMTLPEGYGAVRDPKVNDG
ncbi:MAG: hypothetical protein QM645_11335 [Asticcacaulis sp.]